MSTVPSIKEKIIQIMHSESEGENFTFSALTNRGRIFERVHRYDGEKRKHWWAWEEIKLPNFNN